MNNKSKIGNKSVGCMLGSENDYRFKNIVRGYLPGGVPVLIKTNLSQELWDKFCESKLTKEELEKYA